jgi:hypothetical protein
MIGLLRSRDIRVRQARNSILMLVWLKIYPRATNRKFKSNKCKKSLGACLFKMSHFQDSLCKNNRICRRDAKWAKSGGQSYNFNLPRRRYEQALLSGGRSICGLGEKAEGTCRHSSLRTAQQPAFHAEPRCELRTSSALAERNPTETANRGL